MRHLVFGLVVALLFVVPASGASGGSSYAYVTTNDGKIVKIDISANPNTVVGSPILLPDGASSAHGVAVAPDGSQVYIVHDVFINGKFVGRLSILDTGNGSVRMGAQLGAQPRGVAVRPDGKKVYATNLMANTLVVLDTKSNTITSVPVGLFAFGVAVSGDGNRVYITHAAGIFAVTVIDARDNTPTSQTVISRLPRTYGQFAGVAVSLDNRWIYAANTANGELWIIDAASIEPGNAASVKIVSVGTGPYGIAVSPDGQKVYVANGGSGDVSVVNTADSKVTPVRVGRTPRGISVTSDGSRVYVVNQEDNSVSVIKTSDNTVMPPIPVTPAAGPVAFGNFVSSANVLTVTIDIRPGGNPNSINTKSKGTVPVAILGSADYEVMTVDVGSVHFAGAPVKKKPNGDWMMSYDFVNDDGFIDLVLHFDMQSLNTTTLKVVDGATVAPLEGKMVDVNKNVTSFEGWGPVRIIQ